MNPAVIIFAFFAIAFGGLTFWRLYNSGDHDFVGKKENLREDARVVDVQVKTVGDKAARKYRTIVTFDDGYRYVSHHTEYEGVYGTAYTIHYTPEMKAEIVSAAVTAHASAMGIDLELKARQEAAAKRRAVAFSEEKVPAWKRVQQQQEETEEAETQD